jgi:hypothetical protein
VQGVIITRRDRRVLSEQIPSSVSAATAWGIVISTVSWPRRAHDDGLVVLARMDSNRAHQNLYEAHPDWFAVDGNGQGYRAADLYTTCINSPYYEQYLPDVMREIIERSHPEGFTDNSWSGLSRSCIGCKGPCLQRFLSSSCFSNCKLILCLLTDDRLKLLL